MDGGELRSQARIIRKNGLRLLYIDCHLENKNSCVLYLLFLLLQIINTSIFTKT